LCRALARGRQEAVSAVIVHWRWSHQAHTSARLWQVGRLRVDSSARHTTSKCVTLPAPHWIGGLEVVVVKIHFSDLQRLVGFKGPFQMLGLGFRWDRVVQPELIHQDRPHAAGHACSGNDASGAWEGRVVRTLPRTAVLFGGVPQDQR